MAGYLQRIDSSFVPQNEYFTPDEKSMQESLMIREQKYQVNKQKLETLYGSLLNSPLTKDVNKDRREKFFTDIKDQIKKISASDLSLSQNLVKANDIFTQLTDDKSMLLDMNRTKQAQEAYSEHQYYQNL